MQGKKESYKYQDGRDFRLEDGRHKPGYMSLYRDEFLHLYRTCSKTAIGLYAFVGTTVSGNSDGFNVGGKVLQEELGAGRSTLYEALGQLVDAGLVERSSRDGRTVIRLVDVWKSRKRDLNLSEISDDSRPKSRTSREDNSYSNSKRTIPPIPQGENPEMVLRIQKHLLQSDKLDALRDGCENGDLEILRYLTERLNATGWNGSYRKRDILKAMKLAAQHDRLHEAQSAFENQKIDDERDALVEHIENLKDIEALWEVREERGAAANTRLQIEHSEAQLAALLAE